MGKNIVFFIFQNEKSINTFEKVYYARKRSILQQSQESH